MAEWVYNEANIDSSKVVWARDMGSTDNEELIRYFKTARVWLLEADDMPPKLSRLTEAGKRRRASRAP